MAPFFLFFFLFFNYQVASPGSAGSLGSAGSPGTSGSPVSTPTGCNSQLVNIVGDWSVQSDRLPLTLSAGNSDLKNIVITGAFVESATREALPGEVLLLCLEPDGPCSSNISVPANTTKTVYLKYQGPIRPGVYGGKVTAHAQGCTGSTSQALNLYVSSNCYLVLGIATVIVGGLLAWWVKVYAANRVTRNQALLPIALLSERLNALNAVLKSANRQLKSTTLKLSRALDDWTEQFDVVSLEVKYNLPRKTPSPFVRTPSISSDYTTFLSKADSAINLLTVFIEEGLQQVVELTALGQIPSGKASPAISEIDSLYVPTIAPEVARQGINDVISKARATAPGAAAKSLAIRAPAPISRGQLLTEIRRLNVTAWCVLLAVAAVGTIITIVLKPGFGKLSDYLICLTTSFGIPIVGSLVIPSQTTVAAITDSSHAVSGSRGVIGL